MGDAYDFDSDYCNLNKKLIQILNSYSLIPPVPYHTHFDSRLLYSNYAYVNMSLILSHLIFILCIYIFNCIGDRRIYLLNFLTC